MKRKTSKRVPREGRPLPRSRKAPKRRTVARTIREQAKALRALGAENIKKGKKTLGKTRFLTPTSQGLRSVHSALKEIRTIPKRRQLFTLDLAIRYVGKDGTRKQRILSGVGVPLIKNTRKFKMSVERTIRKQIRLTTEDATKVDSPEFDRMVKKMGLAKARATLAKIKLQRGVKVQVRFNREDF